MPAFIKFDGVDGEATERDHKGWIEVLSYSWGIFRPAPPTPDGGSDGKVQFQDFQFLSHTCKATPKLAVAVCAGRGKVFPKVEIHVVQAGGDGRAGRNTFLKVELHEVMVTSLSQGGQGDDRPVDQVIASFRAAMIDTGGTGAVLSPEKCETGQSPGAN